MFDKEISFDASEIEPRITYGTNPGMGIGITTENIPNIDDIDDGEKDSFVKDNYMGCLVIIRHKVDYVFWVHVQMDE